MKHLATTTTFLLYWFAVLAPIESKTYLYNYTNFQEFFHQGGKEDFNLKTYESMEADSFKTKYTGIYLN